MSEFDVFISHASEDKTEVARPLTDALKRAGLRVWLDEFELQLGDSLREKIDQGLSRSRFGVVILSPTFFEKQWPARELNGLFAIEEDGEKRILPVWHNVDKRAVRSYSPMLADRLAAQTSSGLESVTNAITKIVQKDGVTATLCNLVEAGPSVEAIQSFLKAYPSILGDCVGQYGGAKGPQFINEALPPFHLLSSVLALTNGTFDWRGFLFLPSQPSDDENESISYTLNLCEKTLRKANTTAYTSKIVHNLLSGMGESLLTRFPNERYDIFKGAVFYGRRGQLSEKQQKMLREKQQSSRFLEFYSYDRLLEVSIKSQ